MHWYITENACCQKNLMKIVCLKKYVYLFCIMWYFHIFYLYIPFNLSSNFLYSNYFLILDWDLAICLIFTVFKYSWPIIILANLDFLLSSDFLKKVITVWITIFMWSKINSIEEFIGSMVQKSFVFSLFPQDIHLRGGIHTRNHLRS